MHGVLFSGPICWDLLGSGICWGQTLRLAGCRALPYRRATESGIGLESAVLTLTRNSGGILLAASGNRDAALFASHAPFGGQGFGLAGPFPMRRIPAAV
jgi:hypothetical protein